MVNIKKWGILLSLVVTVALCFVFSVSPAFAEGKKSEITPAKKAEIEKELGIEDYDENGDPYETGIGVHADENTFKKDFSLTVDQKEYTITEMQRVVSEIIDPQMSDLEKYYTLAVWVNKHVEYDWEFWCGRYYFEYYSHQWDSYGGMKDDERSVCAGIAIFYANMCHAAGLPCKFVRLDPKHLDHTINYIPDINGHAYLVDVTEDVFLMSEHSSSAFSHIDKAFANITKNADDETFDYRNTADGELVSSTIKEYYDTPFDTWFNEYARHKNTKKIFKTPYVELGSGVRGQNHASYRNYESNRTKNPDIWFMDDFYEDTAGVSAKVLSGQFDDQVTSVTGVKKGYDCDSESALMGMVENDIQVKNFPSAENGKIVAKTANLKKDVDFTLSLDSYDEAGKKAQFTVKGIGSYSGTKTFTVSLNSAVVEKEPVRKSGLIYTGDAQNLIVGGEATNGEMQYAIGDEKGPTGEFSTEIPSAVNAGAYHIWYKAVGDDTHGSTTPERLEKAVTISKVQLDINVEDMTIEVGQTAKAKPALDNGMTATFGYYTFDDDIVKIDKKGNITGLNVGHADIIVSADLGANSQNYEISDWVYLMVDVDATSINNAKVSLSKSSFVYNGKVQKPEIKTVKGLKLKDGRDYAVKWSDGSSKKAGKYKVVVEGKGNYIGSTEATYTITKAANPMTLKGKTVKVKRKTLKKKSKSIKRAKAYTVRKAKGKRSYKLVSARKGKKSFTKKFKVNAKTGKVTVKKGLKKGAYKVKVKVKAKGNANYKASAWKTVTFKVRVK
ncbi:transglutaminase-like domain-containing protein [Eubacterium sp. AB3007]|uniref:transglutaminase domain-containing protein n=1 Tax=Eubacterium sp. AB3007 TaxID=1392487 RepID=UPI0006901359|nr:transglutaminase-like domain-containing protein [Eubacterium sp. AB3007]